MDDLISRQAVIDEITEYGSGDTTHMSVGELKRRIEQLPAAQPEYEPVKAEDFAKTMSERTLYSFITWHGEALRLMERWGFVICKKII